ncbi:M48 family metalloprotease [Candidatus Albibeggiatoa sp. nov. BB20]|uniref:M48 family metallopeptidase n=1 Tax=Candidatus Albibeggiatoa sp. nov. BB20 TaxID=3162723 RepID=UPI003365A0E2
MINSAYGFIDAPDLEDYLNGIITKLEQHLPVPAKASVHVEASSSFNAYAMPAGNIILSHGLITQIQNEDQIAAILAHELSHVVLKHFQSDAFLKSQNLAISLKDKYSSAKTAYYAFNNERPATQQEYQKDQLEDMGTFLKLSEVVLFPTWTRHQEKAADRLAIQLLQKTGYNWLQLVDVLKNLPDWQSTTSAENSEHLVSSLEKKSARLLGNKTSRTNLVGQAFDQFGSKISGFVQSKSTTHPTKSERAKEIQQYLRESNIISTIPPAINTASWKAMEQKPSIKILFDNYAFADKARHAFLEKNLVQAERFAANAVKRPTQNHPYPRLIFSQIREAQYKPKLALQNIAQYTLDYPYQTFQLYERMHSLELKNNKPEAAASALEGAYNDFGQPIELLPRMIALSTSNNDLDKAKHYWRECELNANSNVKIIEECRKALK